MPRFQVLRRGHRLPPRPLLCLALTTACTTLQHIPPAQSPEMLESQLQTHRNADLRLIDTTGTVYWLACPSVHGETLFGEIHRLGASDSTVTIPLSAVGSLALSRVDTRKTIAAAFFSLLAFAAVFVALPRDPTD